jgi:hypothetical protein
LTLLSKFNVVWFLVVATVAMFLFDLL